MPSRILVLTYWGYKESLIKNFTLPYLQLIHTLDTSIEMHLFTLNKSHQQIRDEELPNIQKELAQINTKLVAHHYNRFSLKAIMGLIGSIIRLVRLIRKEKITHIHAFCTPAGAIGYLLTKFTQVKLIIDSYEPHADSMVESGVWGEKSWAYRILHYFEKKQTQHADHLISLTKGMYNYAVKTYGCIPKSFHVKASLIDVTSFDINQHVKQNSYFEEWQLDDKIVGLYAGKMGGLYLEDEIFDWIKVAFEYWGDQFTMIIMGPTPREVIENMSQSRSLPVERIISDFFPIEQVKYVMGLADFALTPVKPLPSKRFCSPIKNGEYWALGLPVIITKNISDDSKHIKDHSMGYVLEELSTEEYLQSINWINDFLNSKDLDDQKARIRDWAYQTRDLHVASELYKMIYCNDN